MSIGAYSLQRACMRTYSSAPRRVSRAVSAFPFARVACAQSLWIQTRSPRAVHAVGEAERSERHLKSGHGDFNRQLVARHRARVLRRVLHLPWVSPNQLRVCPGQVEVPGNDRLIDLTIDAVTVSVQNLKRRAAVP